MANSIFGVNPNIAAGTWLGGGPAGVVNRPPLANRVICEAVSVVSASLVCIVGEEHGARGHGRGKQLLVAWLLGALFILRKRLKYVRNA